MCVNAVMALLPEKIMLGGGVMHRQWLLPMVHEKTLALFNGSIAHTAVEAGLREYIVTGDSSGVLGAWLLAKQAYAPGSRT